MVFGGLARRFLLCFLFRLRYGIFMSRLFGICTEIHSSIGNKISPRPYIKIFVLFVTFSLGQVPLADELTSLCNFLGLRD